MPPQPPIPLPEIPALIDHPAINRMTAEFCEEVESELTAILASTCFRSSRKSCEFLQHIVQRVLEGRPDTLKERALGVDIMGRSASYDTGSDASVRVRANDVRRRLASYYEQNGSSSGLRIELPAGSYVPQFVRLPLGEEEAPAETAVVEPVAIVPTRLDLRYLAAPTVLALFICVIAIRYELLGTTPFQSFWTELLKGRSQIEVVLDARSGSVDAVDVAQMQASVPLLTLATAYRMEPVIRVNDRHSYEDRSALLIQISNQLPPHFEHNAHTRYVISGTGDDARIVDQQTSGRSWNHSSLISIVRGSTPLIWIAATDIDSLRVGVRVLTERSTFPQSLLANRQPGELTQLLFDEQGRAIDIR